MRGSAESSAAESADFSPASCLRGRGGVCGSMSAARKFVKSAPVFF